MERLQRDYPISEMSATEQLAKCVAAFIEPPFWIALEGDLGVGKTTWTRAFLRAKGWKGAVRSPTYTLIEPYALDALTCYHLDLYRLGDAEELEYLGWRDLQHAQAIVIVEWASNAAEVLSSFDWEMRLQQNEIGERIAVITAFTERGRKLVEQMPETLAGQN